ncbi:acetyl-coenzyme A transporter 1-domain-containing protein [Armillaria borealis]|uniref:Acetyl-coenzyme A transporter 1-domain-containing protein n=1 Tax=Armillaria borealis TaxID=47425 RepID=A0AA39K9I5_9AGAR|nr:acetyl-coenzyme A transporter 1-domain-containing protein [Armillaria borealis]
MPARRKKSPGARASSRRTSNKNHRSDEDMPTKASTKDSMARSSSLHSIHVTPRTPITSRSHHNTREEMENDAEEGLEMSLLGEEERRQATRGVDEDASDDGLKHPMSAKDKRAMVLLCVLYLIQGSVPFLLKDHLSYSQLATFALSSYPYSLKLLWSPIVDSVFFVSVGRRKSWIIPMQLIVGTLMLYISFNVQRLMDDAAEYVYELTFVFTSLVFISATQGTATQSWALTLLSHENLSYASTCQTIGLNTGYFASFTVFLAFNSREFTDQWGLPHLFDYLVTMWLLFFKKEDKEPANEADMSISGVYKTIWSICKLKHIQQLIIMHFFAKLGFAANDAATSLKMVEKGFRREELAVAVLIDFPFQIAGGWLAARWSRGDRPLRPWVVAFVPRLFFCLVGTLIVYWFPTPPISGGFFVFLIVQTVLASFSSTVQFVGISAFHTRVSDPLIGGTYMTVCSRFFSFSIFLTSTKVRLTFGTPSPLIESQGVDLFSVATCKVTDAGTEIAVRATECVSDYGKAMCNDINGECITDTDGYYVVSIICMTFGILFLFGFIIPTARKLQELPSSVWRVKL